MGKIGDPSDKANDSFQGSHRGGYNPDKLAFLIEWFTAHPHASNTHSGEPALLVNEIIRLRTENERLLRMVENLQR